ncbi:MAG: DnaJ family domain-containing protein [Pseudomonadota bacterium]
MFFLTELAERKIAEAIERGDPATLVNTGSPLDLDTDRHVPSEVRALYRVLKHAGAVPADVARLRELARLRRVPPDGLPPEQRRGHRARIAALIVALDRHHNR